MLQDRKYFDFLRFARQLCMLSFPFATDLCPQGGGADSKRLVDEYIFLSHVVKQSKALKKK